MTRDNVSDIMLQHQEAQFRHHNASYDNPYHVRATLVTILDLTSYFLCRYLMMMQTDESDINNASMKLRLDSIINGC